VFVIPNTSNDCSAFTITGHFSDHSPKVHTNISQGTSSIHNYRALTPSEVAHTFFLKMTDGIHSTGVAMHGLFLAAIHSITDATRLLRVTGCDAVDRNMVVRLYGSDIAAWQGSH